MLWNDLRDFLAKLDALGELRRVEEASWEEDIGGITELMVERQGHALLFDDIPGYPRGYRVATNLFTTVRRTALALGLPFDTEDATAAWREVIPRITPVPPVEVASGPILENGQQGDAVDLFKFPAPKWHESDGGRYIGTGVCVIQRDPDTGFVNVGAYRVVIQDKDRLGIFIEHGKHGDAIRRKYWARGERCPIVVSAGQEPILTALAASNVYHCPEGVSELEVAGFLHGSPYPV